MPHCEQVQHAISAKKHCLESMNELDEFLGSKMNSNSWYD